MIINKKFSFICFSILCISFLGNAQDFYWNKVFDIGGNIEDGQRLAKTDSALFVLHTYNESGNWGYLRAGLSRFDLAGNLKWTQEFAQEGMNISGNRALSHQEDTLCFVLTPYQNYANNTINYLVKMDSKGDTVLFAELETEDPHRFYYSKMLPDGSVLMTGYSKSDSIYSWIFQKVDARGHTVWHRTFPWEGANSTNSGNDIESTPDGGYVLGGWSDAYDFTMGIQGMVVKTDSLGNIEWVKDIGNKWYESRFSIATVDSFIYVTGKVNVEANDLYPWEGKYEAFLGKYELDGTVIFEKYFGPPSGVNGAIYDLYPMENGDILAFGNHPDISGSRGGLLFKLSNQGDSIWSRYHDYLPSLDNTHIIKDVVELGDGSIVAAGQMVPHPKYWDTIAPAVWMMRVDSMGCAFAGCDSVCVRPDIEYEIDILPDLKVKASFSPALKFPNLVFTEPHIQYDYFEDTTGIYEMSTPGELEIGYLGEGPCNIPIRWDTTIYVDYVGKPKVNGTEMSLRLYPNPARNHVHLNWQNKDAESIFIKVISLQGRIVKETNFSIKGKNNLVIGLTDLNSGIYIVEMKDDTGKTTTSKLVIL